MSHVDTFRCQCKSVCFVLVHGAILRAGKGETNELHICDAVKMLRVLICVLLNMLSKAIIFKVPKAFAAWFFRKYVLFSNSDVNSHNATFSASDAMEEAQRRQIFGK